MHRVRGLGRPGRRLGKGGESLEQGQREGHEEPGGAVKEGDGLGRGCRIQRRGGLRKFGAGLFWSKSVGTWGDGLSFHTLGVKFILVQEILDSFQRHTGLQEVVS